MIQNSDAIWTYQVCSLQLESIDLYSLSSCVLRLFADNFVIDSLKGHQFLVSRPPLPEKGPIQADPASAASEAPEADEGQDGDDAEVSREDSGSTSSPPPANSEEQSLTTTQSFLIHYSFPFC
jgi:hypothetical protein